MFPKKRRDKFCWKMNAERMQSKGLLQDSWCHIVVFSLKSGVMPQN